MRRATWSVMVFKASLLNWLGGPSAFYIYMHCSRSSSGCNGMQDICAQLTGEDLCWIALCYANIFGVAVFNASMLDWIGFHLSSIYMRCSRSSSWCSSMLGICAWLTGEGHMKCNGIQGICAQLGGEGHMKCNGIQCIYAWLTRGSICLPYVCIVLDLAVGAVVCKASVLDWLRGPSAFYIYAMSWI